METFHPGAQYWAVLPQEGFDIPPRTPKLWPPLPMVRLSFSKSGCQGPRHVPGWRGGDSPPCNSNNTRRSKDQVRDTAELTTRGLTTQQRKDSYWIVFPFQGLSDNGNSTRQPGIHTMSQKYISFRNSRAPSPEPCWGRVRQLCQMVAEIGHWAIWRFPVREYTPPMPQKLCSPHAETESQGMVRSRTTRRFRTQKAARSRAWKEVRGLNMENRIGNTDGRIIGVKKKIGRHGIYEAPRHSRPNMIDDGVPTRLSSTEFDECDGANSLQTLPPRTRNGMRSSIPSSPASDRNWRKPRIILRNSKQISNGSLVLI